MPVQTRHIAVIFLLSALALLFIVNISAQSPLAVVNDEVTVVFPDTITFSAEIDSAQSVVSATLFYGTNSMSCQPNGARQPVAFSDNSGISLEWEWELKRSGAIPPGTEIWWEWELTTNNETVTTERKTMTITDDRYPWRAVEGENVTVYWYDGDDEFGEAILDITLDALHRIEASAGAPPSDDIQLWVYDSSFSVQQAVVNVPSWTGGVAFPNYGVTVIGVHPADLDWASIVIPHELTHLVVDQVTFNCRGINLPTWLSEGIAVYMENDEVEEREDRLHRALERGTAPSLRSLSSGFSAYGDAANLSYAMSGSVVMYLAETYGQEQLNALFLAMQGGLTIDKALGAVYDLDTDSLDSAWRVWKGFEGTSVAANSAEIDLVTPTTIPTVALPGMTAPTSVPTPTEMPTATSTPIPAATPTDTSNTATEAAQAVAEAVPQAAPTVVVSPPAAESESATGSTARYSVYLLIVIVIVGVTIGSVVLHRVKRGDAHE